MKPNYGTLVISLIPLLSSFAAAEHGSAAANTTAATELSRTPDPESKNRSISWRASEILGTNVKNGTDETVGEIEDLVVDWKSSKVVAVVISTGGFLGIADTLSSVSLSQLKYDSAAKVFRTSLSKEDFKKQPQFKSDAWPDLNDPAMFSKWRAMRDSVGGDVSAPDNTAQNEKDMKDRTPTPMDQGSSESDLKLTKSIRTEVTDTDLSFNAKNVKIISKDGQVVLRGVVESEKEHEAILKIANTHAGSSNVTDDLKVNTK